MSDKKQNKGQETAAEEKVVTRYERKLQKRKEQKEKEQRARKRDMAIGIVVLVALVCVVASFPIRTYLAVNEGYVNIGGDRVTKVEYDYNYNLVVNNYISQYGSMLSYFGLDTSSDFSNQMYTDTLTWKDFFDQMTVDNIIRSKALIHEAEANGFSYDTAEDYKDYEASVKDSAAKQGVPVAEFLRTAYGSYATMSRLAPYVKEAMIANAYYEEVADSKEPSEEEVQTYYDENPDEYDSVDYRMVTVTAELPTEPTELADTAEETGPADEGGEGTDAAEETPYEPSEAEIAKAMEDALVLAEEAEETVAADGELQENVKKSAAASLIRDWLFDSSRKAGDTTIITNESANSYYVLAFEQRYLDQTASADVRVILITETEELTGQGILDEWTGGAATEESFIELVEKYTEDTANTAETGGLFEAIVPAGMDEALGAWLFDETRTAGDTAAVTASDGYTYVMYYVGPNEPEWKLTIRSSLLSQTMTEYMEGIMEGIEVEDGKGNLNYLKVQAAEESLAASESTDAQTQSSGPESTEPEETGTQGTEASE